MTNPPIQPDKPCANADDIVSRVAFVSLGCPKNLVDSEKMLGLLAQDGLIPVSDYEDADAVVINTCGFLEAAKDESLQVINEAAQLKRSGGIKRLIVAGCLVQRHRAKMLEWCPDIDALIGVYDRDHITEAVRGTTPDRPTLNQVATPELNYWVTENALKSAEKHGIKTVGLTVRGRNGNGVGYFESDAARLRLTPRHYAYLRISEGCNQRCTFCTIPSIRGKMRSKPISEITKEIHELLNDGAFEINLIGQDTTSFGSDIAYQPGLAGMLREINQAVNDHEGVATAWLRLMYAYPSCFTDEMIEAIADLEHIVKYIDIPLQHINDRILHAMDRRTSRECIETLLYKLRERIPGIAIRTTMITGFPGETEDEHEELLQFINDFGFDNLGAFKYSPEPGTRAFVLEEDNDLRISDEIKDRRYNEIMETQQKIAFEQMDYLASFYRDEDEQTGVKRSLDNIPQFDILIDRHADSDNDNNLLENSVNKKVPNQYFGRTYFQAPDIDSVTYIITNNRLSPGELVRCTIIDSDGYDLIAKPTADLEKHASLPILQ